MGHGHAALIGLVVGFVLLYFTMPTPSSHKKTASNGHNSKRNLVGHSSSSTTTEHSATSSINLWPGAILKWHIATDAAVSFEITATPAPRWFAIGFVSQDNNGNLMVGPPASQAVAVTLAGGGRVGHIVLDKMPPSDLTLIPINAGCSRRRRVLYGHHATSNESTTNEKNKCSTESVTVTGNQVLVKFTIQNDLGGHLIPGPDGTTHKIIYAYGEVDSTSDIIEYHTSARKGNTKEIDLKIASTAINTTNMTIPTPLPYYAMHGGSLATIWSVTTLIGGAVARYCRQYKWWIDAHQALQTVATVLSLPLTVLSYVSLICFLTLNTNTTVVLIHVLTFYFFCFSAFLVLVSLHSFFIYINTVSFDLRSSLEKLGKGGKESNTHYTSVHGLFGLIFALAASLQGTMGTIAHASFIHQCGIRVTCHSLIHYVRTIHRSLGKLLLVCATAQIMLGLQWYDPAVTLLTHGFIVYAAIAWCSILVLELRHLTHKRKRFNVGQGTGFMGKKELKFDLEIFDDTVALCDKLLLIPTNETCQNYKTLVNPDTGRLCPTKLVGEWLMQCHDTSGSTKMQIKCVGSRSEYLFNHKSMSTAEILEFATFLNEKINKMNLTEDELGCLKETDDGLFKDIQSRVELSKERRKTGMPTSTLQTKVVPTSVPSGGRGRGGGGLKRQKTNDNRPAE